MAAVAILSPHPDDAVLSLWHLLARPGEVAVVNVFGGSPEGHSGDAWWDRLTGAEDSVARMSQRHAEDREALALAGREPANLGFLDGQYRLEPPATGDVAARIDAAVPAGARLLAPASLDGHRDHRIVRDAALALRGAGRDVGLYADVPHSVTYGWPAWVTGAEPDPHLRPEAYWEHVTRDCEVSLAECAPAVERLDPAAVAAKTAAVRRYRTQLPALETVWGTTRPEVLGYEVVWTLPG
jgi:LmbE family N-acetylglucosaminyl deacetylase